MAEQKKVRAYLRANHPDFFVGVGAARASDAEEITVRYVPVADAENIMPEPRQSVVQLVGNREKTFPIPFHRKV